MNRLILTCLCAMAAGCATVELPEVPEFHPANAQAPQSTRIQAFDVLAPVPAPPPDLPVPEGQQLPPQDPEIKMQRGHGMGHGTGGGDKENMGHDMGGTKDAGTSGAVSHEHQHGASEAVPAGEVVVEPPVMEGMMEGDPEGKLQPKYSQDHPPPATRCTGSASMMTSSAAKRRCR